MNSSFGGDEAFAVGMIGFILVMILLFSLLMLLPKIFYLVTLQKAFGRCRPENRTLEPGLVWLMLIPFFDVIWHFFIVINLSDSFAREFKSRGLQVEPSPGKSVGLATCILNACGIIPYLNILTGLAGFVCWIIYWVGIADYSSRLAIQPPASDVELPSPEETGAML